MIADPRVVEWSEIDVPMEGHQMRVLVTGATGFVGSAVTQALLADGHEVCGLVRDLDRGALLAARGAQLHCGDMRDPQTFVPLVAGVDVVVHCAMLAVSGPLDAERTAEMFAADAIMTSALADACLRHGTRLVYTGSCFEWGDHGEDLIDEDTPMTPSPLGVGQARQSRELERRHREEGLDVVQLIPGFVYGPGGVFAAAFVEPARRGQLGCFGHGSNWWSCVHLDDLAAAYVAAITRAAPGTTYAVTDGEPLRLRDLTDLTTDALGLPRTGTVAPQLVGDLIGHTLVASMVTSFRIHGARIRSSTVSCSTRSAPVSSFSAPTHRASPPRTGPGGFGRPPGSTTPTCNGSSAAPPATIWGCRTSPARGAPRSWARLEEGWPASPPDSDWPAHS